MPFGGGDLGHIGQRLARFLVGVLETPHGRRRVTGLGARGGVRAGGGADGARPARRARSSPASSRGGSPPVHHAELRANLVAWHLVGLVMARYIVGLEPLAAHDRRRGR